MIDQTESMTTIDVNTGSYVGARNLDDTVFKTNLEAAQACIADDPDIRQFTVAPLQSEYDSSYEDDTALTNIEDEVDEESLVGLIPDVADEIDEEDEADELDFDKGPRARRDPYGD